MWWKFDSSILSSEIFYTLSKPTQKGDSAQKDRFYIFLLILTKSNEGMFFHSVTELQQSSRCTLKQCSIVWDICVQNNILVESDSGYSAFQWMKENGLIHDDVQPKTQKEQKIDNSEIKEQVRPNVRLTRKELSKLKETFSDDQISKMLDKLSDYKSQNNKYYSSDYDAIQRWVIGWMRDDESKPKQAAKKPIEFPKWVYAKDFKL